MSENTSPILHITSGDGAGGSLAKSGIPGEVFVWHDILYDGPRKPGWPDADALLARAQFIEAATGGGLSRTFILETLERQYARLRSVGQAHLVLWFDACLFDQSMLVHILAALRMTGIRKADLLCVDAFPGIDPYHGLGQLSPKQFASVYDRRTPVTDAQFAYAETVDRAFALKDKEALARLSRQTRAPLPWVPAAVTRWLQELPDETTGLGRLEQLALDAVRAGTETPAELFQSVSARDTPPLFWGDTTLWAKINALADRVPPLVSIRGPASRLPQWEGQADLTRFRVAPL